jgi:hypothetical protein
MVDFPGAASELRSANDLIRLLSRSRELVVLTLRCFAEAFSQVLPGFEMETVRHCTQGCSE